MRSEREKEWKDARARQACHASAVMKMDGLRATEACLLSAKAFSLLAPVARERGRARSAKSATGVKGERQQLLPTTTTTPARENSTLLHHVAARVFLPVYIQRI